VPEPGFPFSLESPGYFVGCSFHLLCPGRSGAGGEAVLRCGKPLMISETNS
jgi:hypothetical protein